MFVKIYNGLFDYGLKPKELMVFLFLSYCQNCLGTATVRNATIQQRCGLSENTIRSAVAGLEQKGLLVVSARQDREGRRISNQYKLLQLSGAWGKLPVEAFNLDKRDFAVYAYLCRCSNGQRKEYGFGVPEDYKGSAGLKPGSWVRVPVPGCRKKMLRVVVRVAETATPLEGLKMIGYSGRQIAQTANKKNRRAAHQGGIIYLAKKAKAEKRAMLGGRPIDLAWEAEKAAWIEDDLDIEPYLAKGYNTDEGLPKLTELRLGMRMGFDESSYDDPTLSLRIIKKRRVHQLRDWAREQGLLPPMYYEDPVHGIDKNQLRELLIGIANGIMPDTYGLKLIKLHKCGPRVLREMRLCREAGMTGKEIRPYWALGVKKLQEVRAAFLAEKETDDGQ